MKLKKSDKLVVSKKMFASTKIAKKKDSDGNLEDSPKKKGKKKANTTSKKTGIVKKKKASPSPKPKRADKDPLKSPRPKTKTDKKASKTLGTPSPSKTIEEITPSKKDGTKDVNWSELGVQRCSGCNFTTNEEGIFAAHLYLCRLFNKSKLKSSELSSKKKWNLKSDSSVGFVTKPTSKFGMVIMPEKRAVIQEPYLEGSTPAQTVFLFRCYHCRAYFINIQTLKEHHRLTHGNKNLTVSLVPFTDDEAPDNTGKKVIVDGTCPVPQVTPIPTSTVASVESTPNPPDVASKSSVYSYIDLTQPTSTSCVTTTPTTVVLPKMATKLITSETVSTDTTSMKMPSPEVIVQVSPSSDKGTKKDKVVIKDPEDTPKCSTGSSVTNHPKLVPVSSSTTTTSQSATNKMVVLNLVPKNQVLPRNPVHIEIPVTSPLHTHNYFKPIPNPAKVSTQVVQTNQQGSKKLTAPTKNKTILPKSILLGVKPPPVIDKPGVPQMSSGSDPNSTVTLIPSGSKIISTTNSLFTNTPGITPIMSSTNKQNRKIILFPLTSTTSTSTNLVTAGTSLTANPVAAAITTSAVVTCATSTSPSMLMPLSNSLAKSSLQTSVTPQFISSGSPLVTSSVSSVERPVVVFPPQTSLASLDSQLTSSSHVQNTLLKSSGLLTKTVTIKSTVPPTRVTHSVSTSLPMTTQAVATVMANSPLSVTKIISQNRSFQNQLVTITPASEINSPVVGTSLLEKMSIVKPIKSSPVTTKEKSLNPVLVGSSSQKPVKVVEIGEETKMIKTISPSFCSTDQATSKSVQCILTPNTKRKMPEESNLTPAIISPSPKKKALISSTNKSTPKNQNETNSESEKSVSTSPSKDIETSENFTVALLAKKKVPDSSSDLVPNNSLNPANISPLVIVRKSVGSNKLVVHTMVSANKLFQVLDSDLLKCSLCPAKVNANFIRSHLYWHFHIENRNSSQCSKENPCNYCSVIDYVISTTPKKKNPEEGSSEIIQKPSGGEDDVLQEQQEPEVDTTVSQDGSLTVESSSNSMDTEFQAQKISSSVTLTPEVTIVSEDENTDRMDVELESAPKEKTEILSKITPQDSDSQSDDMSEAENSSMTSSPESITGGSPVEDVEMVKEAEALPVVTNKNDNNTLANKTNNSTITNNSDNKNPSDNFLENNDNDSVKKTPVEKPVAVFDMCKKTAPAIHSDLKKETPNQSEKSTTYKGNFYICGFKECMFSSLGVEDFESHLKKDHVGADSYSCVHCQMDYTSPEVLIRHMNSHLCGDMFILYRCAFPECNFGTNLMKSFSCHNTEVHPRETVFLCYYCNDYFQGCGPLHKHLQANLLKYVHCPHCSVRNSLRDTILSHIKSKHPDKPRRIFVTGQMVCQQKQQAMNGSIVIDSESDVSDIDSDCMIVDDETHKRPLKKNAGAQDVSGKTAESKKSPTESPNHKIRTLKKNAGAQDVSRKTAESKKSPTKSPNHKNPISDDDCMIIDKALSDKQNIVSATETPSGKDVRTTASGTNDKQTSDSTKPTLSKKNETAASKETVNMSPTVLIVSNISKGRSSPEERSKKVASSDKDVLESDEGCTYLRVKKVTHTYSRQKENRLSLRQRHLEDAKSAHHEKCEKEKTPNSNERLSQDSSATLAKVCKRRILIHNNKPHGKVDIGTTGLDSIVNPLYLIVDNEVHCRICTFKCIPLQKMHSHIMLMHLHVYLYKCKSCNKKTSCKIEITDHCKQHGAKNKGFATLPEPNWDQVIRRCLPAPCKASPNLKSNVSNASTQKLSLSNKTKLTKTESKAVGPGRKKKSPEILMASKENSGKSSSKTASNEDRNIFSLFSFGLESETDTSYSDEDPKTLKSHKQNKLDSSFSNKLLNLSSRNKTPVKDPSSCELFRTSTSDSNDQITVGKEQYMRKLHLVAISKVSKCKPLKKTLTSFGMSSQLTKSPNSAMAKLRSWRSATEKTAFALGPKSLCAKKPKKPLSHRKMLVTPKTVRKKVLSKKPKLKTSSRFKGRLLRSAGKLHHSPRKSLTKRRHSSIVKTPEKRVVPKRPQGLKNSSSSSSSAVRSRSIQSAAGLKSKLKKNLTVKQKKARTSPRKLIKTSVKSATKKKNWTISHGKRSLKKALNRASRKTSVHSKDLILKNKKRLCRGRPILKTAPLRKTPPTDLSNCLYFSCSWCLFSVSDREHFQRHISLHNFFPQGCKMYCPYCSYTTPNALILEKHIPMHMDKHPFGCRHCGFSAKTKMMVIRHCKRSHPEIPLKLVNRSTCSQKLKPSWPVVSFSPKVRLKKCNLTNDVLFARTQETK